MNVKCDNDAFRNNFDNMKHTRAFNQMICNAVCVSIRVKYHSLKMLTQFNIERCK